MERWMHLAGWVMLGGALIGLLLQLPGWLAARRAYGQIPWSVSRSMLGYACKTPKILWVYLLLGSLGLTILLELRLQVKGAPYDRLVAIAGTLIIVQLVLSSVIPPSILYLASSTTARVDAMKRFRLEISPHRVVALVEAREHMNPIEFSDYFLDNLRTRSACEWRWVAFQLMDVVPVVVFDCRDDTRPIREEGGRIVERNLSHKTVVVADDLDGARALLRGENPDTVLKCLFVEEGGLRGAVQAVLQRNEDTAERRCRQREYVEMIRAIPLLLRTGGSVNEILIRAERVFIYAYDQYLRRCKGITAAVAANRFVEDLPSIVSPAEELQCLRESRGLELYRATAQGALEEAQNSPGEYQAFNIANAWNKLGKIARFRRDWQPGVECLNTAIRGFRSMLGQCPGPRERDVLSELADAHFLLAEIHMARYRETGAEEDKEQAQVNFESCAVIDRTLGRESEVPSRLATL